MCITCRVSTLHFRFALPCLSWRTFSLPVPGQPSLDIGARDDVLLPHAHIAHSAAPNQRARLSQWYLEEFRHFLDRENGRRFQTRSRGSYLLLLHGTTAPSFVIFRVSYLVCFC